MTAAGAAPPASAAVAAPAPPGPVWPATPGLPALRPGDRVHLVGVGGAGMSGLARVLAARGLIVSGSDRSPEALGALAAEGVTVQLGHRAEHLPAGCALVVRSPAVPDENPELAAARSAGIPITKRAVLLGALLDAAAGIAVAGTHGKTTTTGLVAWILECAGLAPTYFVGGELLNLGTNAAAGRGEVIVLEADEYDRSFLHGHPLVGVVTTIEHDHPDIYADLAAVRAAFGAFVALIRPEGLLVANAAAAGVDALVAACPARGELYAVEGDGRGEVASRPAWQASDVVVTADGQLFDLHHDGACVGTFALALPGRHNVGNAVAAIAAARAVDVGWEDIRAALASYRGAARRFQLVSQLGGVSVLDDYAHHPTEIRVTLEAARSRFPGRRLWAIWQPHTYTRVAAMAAEFQQALQLADRAVVTPIYAAREAPLAGLDAERLAAGIPGAVATADLADAAAILDRDVTAGDVVLCLGAGDITRVSRALAGALAERAIGRLLAAADQAGLGGTVLPHEPLAGHTSLRVGGPADVMVRVGTSAELAGWHRLARSLDVPVRVIGRGTNVLGGDDGVRGLVLLNRCEAWSLEPALDGRSARLEAESGVTLAALGPSLARAGWAGLEAAVGIPGSIGAAVVTNAGAHGWSMADSVASVEVLEPDGTIRTWTAEELGFGYRHSRLKGDATRVVLRASVRLSPADPAELAARIAAFTAQRRATQPTTPSVGSIFKNPPGDYAGRLIEAAGLKGRRIGGAQISPVHANFFVNVGAATATDVHQLIALAHRTVRDQFGICLELEIEPLGDGNAV
jgi:UDP-N-acetylmuramate--L-alanine ligase/UDP-N-acetylenolpyruvoylglucosamine reductase